MNAPPAFQFYPDDFIGGTVDLSQEERGAYICLICYQWGRGSIPLDNPPVLERIAGGQVSLAVLSKFPGGKNQRLERERAKQIEYREKQSQNGQKGGRPKGLGLSGLSQTISQTKAKKSSPSPSPISNLQSPSPSTDCAKAAPCAVNGEHAAFIKGWTENFKAAFNFDYSFDGGKDGKAVKELLKLGIPHLALLEIAKQAWSSQKLNGSFWNCKQASTIHGFKERLNQIRAELSPNTKKPEPQQIQETINVRTL